MVFLPESSMSQIIQKHSEQHVDWRVRMRTIPHGDSDCPVWLKWLLLIPTLLFGGLLVLGFGGIPLGMCFGVGVDEIPAVTWMILGCGLNLGTGLIGAIWSMVLGVSSIPIRIGFLLFTFFAWFFLVYLLSGFIRWFL